MSISFGSSQQVTMNKLLLRRSTSATEDQQDDALTDLPTVHETTNLPTTYHKRKQSDVLNLPELEISHADVKSTYSAFSPIEQGTAADAEEDGAYFSGSSSQNLKNRLSPFFSPCQLVLLFVAFASVTTLHSVRSRTTKTTDIPFYTSSNEDGGYEEIGEPVEAQAPEEDWVEFYNSPDRMPLIKSSGPWPVDPKVGGLHKFENVCVTNNIDAPKPPELDTSSRGLLYFTDKVTNPKRCIPCSKRQMNSRTEDRWDAISKFDSDLGHHCGMKGLHAMMVKSVGDYNHCMGKTEHHKLLIRARQNQSPAQVKQIHFFEDPTFLLQFDAHHRESSLFDMLMTYLPHWHQFASGRNYPFDSVISHSVEGCLTHSKNWLCEVLHQAGALGYSRELQWERKESTLYCFKTLYYNQLEYQRELMHEGLVTKPIMDAFRDELFRNLALPGPRDLSEVRKKDAKIGMKRPINIVLYGGDEWKDMKKLVQNAQSIKKYHNLEFNIIDNFDGPVAEQATAFNLADAVIMATGDHMANAIFSPDDIIFVETGCSSMSLIGNGNFMKLLSGTHISTDICPKGQSQSTDGACISCSSDNSFTMTEKYFHSVIDDIIRRHEEHISFMRDSL